MAVRNTASLLAGLLLVLFHTWRAWAALEVYMNDTVEVALKGTAKITCRYTSEEGRGSMDIQWFFRKGTGERHKICEQVGMMTTINRTSPYANRISVNDTETPAEVALSIRDVQLSDEVDFICRVKSISEDHVEGHTTLKVFGKPDHPTIEGVTTGISVNADSLSKIGTCEVRNGYPKPKITWYKNTTPLRNTDNVNVETSTTSESSGLFSVKSDLTMKVDRKDKDATFYCEVNYYLPGTNGIMMMMETTKINITVIYPSTFVDFWIESPKGLIKEGDTVELRCRGDGNAFETYSIKHLKNDDVTWEVDKVVLENVTRLDSGEYECTLTNIDIYEEFSNRTAVFVNYLDEAVLNPSDTVLMDKGDTITATCNALSSLQTNTAWFKNNKKVSKDHSLILEAATFDTSGTYLCVVTVPEVEGMETKGSLHVHVKGKPEIQEKDVNEIETSDETIILSCHAKGYPTPKITWTTSEGKVINSDSQMETDSGAKSQVTVQLTSDVTVFCNASNEFDSDSVSFNIKVKITVHTTPDSSTTPDSTTTPVSTTTITTTSSNPKATAKSETPNPSKEKKESKGVVIAVIIICILLLAILGSVLYFLYKKGKICNRSGKQDITKEKSSKDNIVVEMKSDNTEEAILLGVNGDKQPPGDQ
uniref:Melanoma cell adhesion molecule b n=2 Tax=Nothobranchius kuhntae TaxID=321403 RepID=A0A1A8J1W2_NOTKU